MFKIIAKEQLSENVFKFIVEAPRVARSRRAGHFVIVRTGDGCERVPLTIADADKEKGTLTLVVQRVGVSTDRMCALNAGDSLADVAGPLGRATHIENFGTVVCAAGGVGGAPMLPIVKALKEAGNRVIVVLAARNAGLIILEKEFREVADEVMIMTDDGSAGTKGLVTAGIEAVAQREAVHKCFAIGPAIMMKFVCLLTKKLGISTDVSLNTIMVDGTGMCGACRITVGGVTKFVCVDGPEFDGHQVDFDEMLARLAAFKGQESEDRAREQAEGPLAHFSQSSEESAGCGCTSADGCLSQGEPQPLKAKERVAIPRSHPIELPAAERAHLLRSEVSGGLRPEDVQREASRCLNCAKPGCVEGCPVSIDIPRFVKQLERGDVAGAAATLRKTSALPAVCGRVCPQEKQCEGRCIHLKMGSQPVAIGLLERYAADHDPNAGKAQEPVARNGHKVAVVGSGPAGLSFAGDMAARGYDVTVYEALHEIGGVLKYGIPEFRLPNAVVDREIESLRQRGVEFVRDCIVGKTISIDALRQAGFEGIFVASGAGLPNFMGIPGENAPGVMSSNEYLTRVNLMDAANEATDTPVPFGRHVAVVGGGNTAMDAVRTALRLGAERAFIVYRRTEEEMPARLEEVRHAKEEGVEFLTLCNPIECLTDDKGRVSGLRLQKMVLGEPDASGRRRPVPDGDKQEIVEADLVIMSIGVSPNPIVPSSVAGLETGRKGTIAVNDDMESSVPMLFAGGDIVRGGATVILAMGDGRHAAATMHAKIMGES
ncbi:MAG: bifunctional dihydroorotate dehydrogenase B NAD binding subunit/NADPH-dependent glutamate synthase [Bacteroidales bacterium]|nr:bifunctional dihydroorotate dehydrogenase B NAD binding subunit/NADPH-dependent glutamate synthase [Bacteroidales bacterium]